MNESRPRYAAEELRGFARTLAMRAGCDADIARDLADVLLEGDLLGHTTHGLALLAPYLKVARRRQDGEERPAEGPVAAHGRANVDGERLPGPWLTLRALESAMAMARATAPGTVVIRRSHHIACLAAFLKRATDAGLVVALIECSDPTVVAVAPHGGLTPFITPNPIAAGLPTSGDPILLDASMSITTMGYALQQMRAGKKLPGAWLIDPHGEPTDDPGAMVNEPKGALLPLGGIDAGHSGFALALLVEALTGGLAGHGRADPPEGWTSTTFVQVLDPEAFGGLAAFRRQMDAVAAAARNAKPRPGVDRVRLPGERGLAHCRDALAHGVPLYPTILPALEPWAERYGIAAPSSIDR
jgi:LDH2 family malate/lactate/ureidoglycolate dehydrogenase